MDLHLKAKILSNAIIDAVVSVNPILVNSARTWLFFDHRPTKEDILNPAPLGFIAVCLSLGICWRRLRRDLIRASRIDPPKRKLSIVPHREFVPYSKL